MSPRRAFPPPGGELTPPAGTDAGAHKAQRLVLRSGENGRFVTLTRRRPDQLGVGGDDPARGRGRGPEKRWQPPEGLTPEEVKAVIAAAETERDRLLLRTLWATGGRVSEVLALRATDVRRDA